MTFPISFNSTPLHEYSLKDSVKLLKKHNYNAIELNASISPFGDPHIKTVMTKKEIENIINDLTNIEVSSISAHFELIQKDISIRENIINYTKQSIDIAESLGRTIVHGYSGNAPNGMTDDEAWNILIDVVNEIVKYAEKKNVKYAFEPAANRFINNGETFGRLQQNISSGTLYINLDPANLLVADDSIDTFFDKYSDYIVHVHMKDGLLNNNQIVFPPLGMGHVNFQYVINLLKRMSYKGYLSVEYEAERFGYQKSTEEILKESYEFVKYYV